MPPGHGNLATQHNVIPYSALIVDTNLFSAGILVLGKSLACRPPEARLLLYYYSYDRAHYPLMTLLLISGKQFYKVQKMEPSLMDAGQVVANTDWECSVMVNHTNHLPYSRKIWWFGGLYYNRQIKICQNFLLVYMYIWRSHTVPPN